MGISADDTIVVYDGPGLFSAPRVWWMFRVMGVSEVYLLDGGFDRWKAEGRPVTAEPTKVAPNVFHVDFDGSRVASLDDMRPSWRRAKARSPTPGRQGALPAPIRNRARTCAAAICRAPGTCQQRRCRGTASCCRRTSCARRFAEGRHRPGQTGGDLMRLGRHGGGDYAGAGNAWPHRKQAVRRLVERMGRAVRHARRDRQGEE